MARKASETKAEGTRDKAQEEAPEERQPPDLDGAEVGNANHAQETVQPASGGCGAPPTDPPKADADLDDGGPELIIVQIAVPVVPLNETVYRVRHVNVNLSTEDQQIGLRRVFDALHGLHAKLANGRHVDTPADAVRWLLERVAETGKAQGNGQ